MDIERNLNAYLGARNATARYASFDYCFNHFQAHRERGTPADLADSATMELSCLHLGFYLASWGMLRGSSALLRKSVKHYAPVIEVVAAAPTEAWDIDANRYGDEEWRAMSELARQLRTALPDGASDILVTKIMLGVFGSVPAFDTYFKKGFGVASFGRRAANRIAAFYDQNSEVIERSRVPTLDFDTGEHTTRTYTRAKVIDMIFFVEGGPS